MANLEGLPHNTADDEGLLLAPLAPLCLRPYFSVPMCGRIVQASDPLRYAFVDGLSRAENVARLPTFRSPYAKRRCIVPVDCFFEWCAIKGERAKQPYAVAMKDRTPFGIAGLWENWRHPRSREWIRRARPRHPPYRRFHRAVRGCHQDGSGAVRGSYQPSGVLDPSNGESCEARSDVVWAVWNCGGSIFASGGGPNEFRRDQGRHLPDL